MEKREVKIGKVEFEMPTKKIVRIKKKRFVKPKKRELQLSNIGKR